MNNKTNPKEGAFAAKNQYSTQVGLTKREYFASIVMQGLLIDSKINSMPTRTQVEQMKIVANNSVVMADAIIKALNE